MQVGDTPGLFVQFLPQQMDVPIRPPLPCLGQEHAGTARWVEHGALNGFEQTQNEALTVLNFLVLNQKLCQPH